MWDLTDSKKDTEKTNQQINKYKRKQQQFIWASVWVLIHHTGVRHELHSLPAHPFGCWTNILEIFSVISLVFFLMCHATLVTCRTCGTGEVERVSHSHSMSLRVSLQSVPAGRSRGETQWIHRNSPQPHCVPFRWHWRPPGTMTDPHSRLHVSLIGSCQSVVWAALWQGGIIDRQSPSSCLLASMVCRAFP